MYVSIIKTKSELKRNIIKIFFTKYAIILICYLYRTKRKLRKRKMKEKGFIYMLFAEHKKHLAGNGIYFNEIYAIIFCKGLLMIGCFCFYFHFWRFMWNMRLVSSIYWFSFLFLSITFSISQNCNEIWLLYLHQQNVLFKRDKNAFTCFYPCDFFKDLTKKRFPKAF